MNTDYIAPKEWRTFQGKLVTPQSIDQQHLSNTYWYGLIFLYTKFDWVQNQLSERFNGQLLPYRPHIDFTHEIETLQQKGMLSYPDFVRNFDTEKINIVLNGEVIGEIQMINEPNWKLKKEEKV